jgi:hypothetical protein
MYVFQRTKPLFGKLSKLMLNKMFNHLNVVVFDSNKVNK